MRNQNINQSNKNNQDSLGKNIFKSFGKGLFRIFGGNPDDSDDEKQKIAKSQIIGKKLNYDE